MNKRYIRANERIRVPEVRVVGPDGAQLGVMPTQKAQELANQHELDLVEITANASPPVCRITDFSKFKYELEKKERAAKKHQHQSKLKEIRLHPNIDGHDCGIKIRQAVGFLKKKDKVKVNMFFRGRQMEHVDIGRRVLDRFIADTANDAIIEKPPQREGRILSMLLAPK